VFDFLRRRKPHDSNQPPPSQAVRVCLENLSNVAKLSLTAKAAAELEASKKLAEFLRLSSGLVPAESVNSFPIAKHVVYSLASGYSPAETVLHAFKLTVACQLALAGNDIDKLMRIYRVAVAALEHMTEWRDSGGIRPNLFENDSNAIMGMAYLSSESEGWIKKVMVEYSTAP
jgi:hypothetical protein